MPPQAGGLPRTVCDLVRSALGAKSTHEKDDEADEQHETKSSATDCGAANVKTAAAEQEEKNDDQ